MSNNQNRPNLKVANQDSPEPPKPDFLDLLRQEVADLQKRIIQAQQGIQQMQQTLEYRQWTLGQLEGDNVHQSP